MCLSSGGEDSFFCLEGCVRRARYIQVDIAADLSTLPLRLWLRAAAFVYAVVASSTDLHSSGRLPESQLKKK